MSEALDAYRLPDFLAIEDPDERFEKLSETLTKAETDRAIARLASSEDEFRRGELVDARIRTIRTRLYLLGYLSRDNKSGRVDKRLTRAIKAFQNDAGLEAVDGWVGIKTWTALQELVSFEHPSNIPNWTARQRGRPALVRAVKLRLFVLGFLESRQARAEKKLHAALERFVKVAWILGLSDSPLEPALRLETLSVLFDQDGTIQHLARAVEPLVVNCPPGISEKQALRKVRKFVACCAQIELWLLGYNVRPDGSGRFRLPMGPHDERDYPLYYALKDFWSDSGQAPGRAATMARSFPGGFFRVLLESEREPDAASARLTSSRIYDALIGAGKEAQKTVWEYIKSIGSRIWDGLKRAWRWLVSRLRKGLQKSSAWLRNVARLAYQCAVNALEPVRRTIKLVSLSFSFLVETTIRGSDVKHLVIRRDADFDYYVYANPQRDDVTVARLLGTFERRARLFALGARIIGKLFAALGRVARDVALGGGWFGLVLALVRSYADVQETMNILDESKLLLACT
jgi:hypothetical protein